LKTDELRRRTGNDTVKSHKTTLLLDGAGNWRVAEIRQSTARREANNRSTEERISQRDSEGNLSEVSRVVSKVHSNLLRQTTLRNLAEIFPERFNNKTNGVTPRRWLQLCNPVRSGLIADAIGDGWIRDLRELSKLGAFTQDSGFCDDFRKAKRDAKRQFCDWLRWSTGQTLDPESIFDCQVKRIHEYKRQFLNALRIVVLYNRLRQDPGLDMHPRTFLFAGKAAPASREPDNYSGGRQREDP